MLRHWDYGHLLWGCLIRRSLSDNSSRWILLRLPMYASLVMAFMPMRPGADGEVHARPDHPDH